MRTLDIDGTIDPASAGMASICEMDRVFVTMLTLSTVVDTFLARRNKWKIFLISMPSYVRYF